MNNNLQHLKKYISGDRSFFSSDMVMEFSKFLFCDRMENEKINSIYIDTIISYSELSKKYFTIEKRFGNLSDLTPLDKEILKMSSEISDIYMNKQKIPSPMEVLELYKKHINKPEIKLIRDTDKSFDDKCIQLTKTYNINEKQFSAFNELIQSKLNLIDIIYNIERYNEFLTKDSLSCDSLEDFLSKFGSVVENATDALSELSKDKKFTRSTEDILKGSFFKDVIEDSGMRIKSGINVLDALMGGGFERKRVIMVSAATGVGKSTTLLNIAQGMFSCINGLYFNELDILNATNDYSLETIIQKLSSKLKNNTSENEKKKIILYITLENTAEENIKRIMCKSGIMTNLIWTMMPRDPQLKKLFLEKGLNFEKNELPVDMPDELKKRLYSFSELCKFMMANENKASLEMVWREPYSIDAYDIMMICKGYEKKGYDVAAVFVDYPDKMKPIRSESNYKKSSESWLELGIITDNLKSLAAKMNTVVITISQMTREVNKDQKLAAKKGNVSGSIHKEYNADVAINMSIKEEKNEVENKAYQEFKTYQNIISAQKQAKFKKILNSKTDSDDSLNESMMDVQKASDILMVKMGIPKMKEISCYVSKNRDGIADISFQLYIVYGMYLVTDSLYTALECSKYACDTYRLLAEYLNKKGLLSPNAYQMCVYMYNDFLMKYKMYESKYKSELQESIDQYTKNSTKNEMASLSYGIPVTEDVNTTGNLSSDVGSFLNQSNPPTFNFPKVSY